MQTVQTVQTLRALSLEPRDYSRRPGAKARALKLRSERRRKSAERFLSLAFGA